MLHHNSLLGNNGLKGLHKHLKREGLAPKALITRGDFFKAIGI